MERDASRSLWESHRSGRDPTAFDRLFTALFPSLVRQLRAQFPDTPLQDLEDSTVEAFASLAIAPNAFDPARAALATFLHTVARHKQIDKIRKQGRGSGTVSLDGLPSETLSDLQSTGEGSDVENEVVARLAFGGPHTRDDLRPDVQNWLQKVLPDPRDRDLLFLFADGRLTVEAFAALYELEMLPLDAQRRAMKQNRERIQKRVERGGTALRLILQDDFSPRPAVRGTGQQKKKP